MKNRIKVLFVAILISPAIYGQTATIETEKWTEKPVIHVLDNKCNKESAVVLFDKRRVEYIDDAQKDVAEYYTQHKIIHINDDRGIESLNKIYLNFRENSDIVDVRARTVLPGGKIIELDKSNIKEIKDKNDNTYKIFAMDGLEKGCEIEYTYTFKRPISYFGREVVQSEFPVLLTEFEVIGPPRLKFDVKPYNFETTFTDTVIDAKRRASCALKETPGLEEEKYAAYVANLKRVEYKLSYNDAGHKGVRLFTWNELAKRIYSIYTEATDKEKAKIAEMISKNGWDKVGDEVGKITAAETYIKNTFSYNEEVNSENGNKLESVIQNKVGGTIGMLRLYATIFQQLNVNYQFVLTADRNKFNIDREFENWNNCDIPLFYFPGEKKFLAPTRPDLRYPWIDPSLGGANGLYCKSTSIGSFTTALAEIKPVLLEDYTRSFQNIESKLELNNNLDSLSIDAKQIYGGYAAAEYRDAFNFTNAEQKQALIKELTKMVSNTDHIVFSETLNQGFENENTNLPLILHTKTKSDALIEKAGNKILLKIGLAIGPQVEMYQEKPRQEPVDMEFPHVEERKLDFVIPAGYSIRNPDDLKIDQTFSENGELTMGFVSTYEIKGNILSIHIIEQYRRTYYPLSQFDRFRKIINASSDFNKVVLVLEKKG